MTTHTEGLRLVSQTMGIDLRPFETRELFAEIDRLKSELEAASMMGLVLARKLEKGDDFHARLASRFIERFRGVAVGEVPIFRDEPRNSWDVDGAFD